MDCCEKMSAWGEQKEVNGETYKEDALQSGAEREGR